MSGESFPAQPSLVLLTSPLWLHLALLCHHHCPLPAVQCLCWSCCPPLRSLHPTKVRGGSAVPRTRQPWAGVWIRRGRPLALSSSRHLPLPQSSATTGALAPVPCEDCACCVSRDYPLPMDLLCGAGACLQWEGDIELPAFPGSHLAATPSVADMRSHSHGCDWNKALSERMWREHVSFVYMPK